MLTQDLLKELFDYNPETGDFKRKVPVQSNGKEPPTSSYLQVRVAGKPHRVHRMIWLWVYGELPKGFHIDHINGDTLDNRLCNLRLAAPAENIRNSKKPCTNTTGYKGVCRKSSKFHAYINSAGKQKNLGVFKTAEEAAKAYDEAALSYFGPFARTNEAMGLLN